MNMGARSHRLMRLPEKQGQDCPPEEALKILGTLQIKLK